MKLAFCLYKYFPYGGLQRDFMRIAQGCAARGHSVRVYTRDWKAERPVQFDIRIPAVSGFSGPAKNASFVRNMQADLKRDPVDLVVGFNKVPGLDVYFAADSCYEKRVRLTRPGWFRLRPRYKHFANYEQAIFEPGRHPQILLISELQRQDFTEIYGTEANRMHLLPPGIDRDRRAPDNAQQVRTEFRAEYGLAEDELLLLQIGSGFKTKGLDRSIRALAALPDEIQTKARLFVVGNDDARQYQKLANRLGIQNQISFLGGRDDVPRFLQGADILIHPARAEAAGMVLVEAVIAGLPVLVTDVCGHAHHISRANAGLVLESPFSQAKLNQALVSMIESEERANWRDNGLRYADSEDLYSLTEKAVDFIEAQVGVGA